MSDLNLAVVVKLEPDLSEGNISYNADGTLDRKKTKNTLGYFVILQALFVK